MDLPYTTIISNIHSQQHISSIIEPQFLNCILSVGLEVRYDLVGAEGEDIYDSTPTRSKQRLIGMSYQSGVLLLEICVPLDTLLVLGQDAALHCLGLREDVVFTAEPVIIVDHGARQPDHQGSIEELLVLHSSSLLVQDGLLLDQRVPILGTVAVEQVVQEVELPYLAAQEYDTLLSATGSLVHSKCTQIFLFGAVDLHTLLEEVVAVRDGVALLICRAWVTKRLLAELEHEEISAYVDVYFGAQVVEGGGFNQLSQLVEEQRVPVPLFMFTNRGYVIQYAMFYGKVPN